MRMAAIAPTIAQNSVVTNDGFVSLRRATLGRDTSMRRSSVVISRVAMVLTPFFSLWSDLSVYPARDGCNEPRLRIACASDLRSFTEPSGRATGRSRRHGLSNPWRFSPLIGLAFSLTEREEEGHWAAIRSRRASPLRRGCDLRASRRGRRRCRDRCGPATQRRDRLLCGVAEERRLQPVRDQARRDEAPPDHEGAGL